MRSSPDFDVLARASLVNDRVDGYYHRAASRDGPFQVTVFAGNRGSACGCCCAGDSQPDRNHTSVSSLPALSGDAALPVLLQRDRIHCGGGTDGRRKHWHTHRLGDGDDHVAHNE